MIWFGLNSLLRVGFLLVFFPQAGAEADKDGKVTLTN